MKVSDQVALISNLLDNSIEECNRIECAEKRIDIKCAKRADNIILICQNTTNKTEWSDVDHITEKRNTSEHGLGLGILDDIVEQYGSEIHRGVKEGVFETIIMIEVECE